MVYRTAPFSRSLNDLYPRFQGHAVYAEYLKNGTRYRHSFSGILMGTYIMPCSRVSYRMILSDLKWLSEIVNDTKRRAVSLRQLSFLLRSPRAPDRYVHVTYWLSLLQCQFHWMRQLCCLLRRRSVILINSQHCNVVLCIANSLWYGLTHSTEAIARRWQTVFFITNQSTFSGCLLISYN